MKKAISLGLIGMFMCVMLPMSSECGPAQVFADEGEVSVAAVGVPITTPCIDVTGSEIRIVPHTATQVYHQSGYRQELFVSNGYSFTMQASSELGADFAVAEANIGIAETVTYTCTATLSFEIPAYAPEGYYRLETMFPGYSVHAYYLQTMPNGMTNEILAGDIAYMPKINEPVVRLQAYSDPYFTYPMDMTIEG